MYNMLQLPLYAVLSISLALAITVNHGRAEQTDARSAGKEHHHVGHEEEEDGARSSFGDLNAAASDSSTLTTKSHKILASGWPSTSQMWPTIQMADDGQQIAKSNSTHWFDMIEPFIYADKPRSNDYSLLLALNKTVLDILKRPHMRPLAVNLSFEYYFSYDQQKITAPPGIRIEVDRKQLEYLEPGNQAHQSIRTKIWLKLNKRILVTETARLDNPDWLKISLVNRQTPSLVAVRHLQAEFILDNNSNNVAQPNGQLMIEQQQPSPVVDRQGSLTTESPPLPQQQQQQQQPQNEHPTRKAELDPVPPPQPHSPQQQQQPSHPPSKQQPVVVQPAFVPPPTALRPPEIQRAPTAPGFEGETPADDDDLEPPQGQLAPAPADYSGEDKIPAASNDATTKVKPDGDPQKKSRWSIWGKGRRKRDTGDAAGAAAAAAAVAVATATTGINNTSQLDLARPIVLTCFHGDQCDWKTDSSEQVQWSLARMPPSTSMVQSGYYYNSNRNNYGNPSHMLRIWLNQTESATIADQNSDHCIELALYVTEGSYLNLFQLKRTSNANGEEIWVKANKLLGWAPTLARPATTIKDHRSTMIPRTSVPKSQLAAMTDGHNGWTFETLCHGDFFSQDMKDCATLGKCAFGFEMDSTGYVNTRHQQVSTGSGLSTGDSSLAQPGLENDAVAAAAAADDGSVPSGLIDDELVVGVALLQEYTINVPIKRIRSNWMESWQRDQVEPGDDWKFYPKLDYKIGADNISLMNMFDDAHYYIQSNWLNVGEHLEFAASLAIEPIANNETLAKIPVLYEQLSTGFNMLTPQQMNENAMTNQGETSDDIHVFSMKITIKLADSNFNSIYSNSSDYQWSLRNNGTQFIDLSLPVTESIIAARHGQLNHDSSTLYKLIMEFVIDTHWLNWNSSLEQLLLANDLTYKISLANVFLSDRCFPNPCQYGSCQQNGTGYDDWNCQCDEQHRGRRCESGRWCNLPHIIPWVPTNSNSNSNNNNNNKNQIILKTPPQLRQGKFDLANGPAGTPRVSGKDYCQRKLGSGSKCTDIDLPLNDNLYTEEDRTFICSCQDDYYLSDDSKCKSAHLCNSIVCPSMGMICDESRPFNRTQPCHCDEKQDWYPDQSSGSGDSGGNYRCIRRQCQDKQRDCQFDAHICLPTLPAERPICKCGPKFTLKINDKGQKYCQSTACVLPTLNDCLQICIPDNSNLLKPYTCACHPGYTLDAADGRTCRPQRPHSPPNCKPGCLGESQICTDAGCRCKQGYVGEGEVRIQQVPKNRQISNTTIDYTQSIKCLNVCSLTYAENKDEFEHVESVCPLGLCDPTNFQCKCSDNSSSALINTKYEPIYDNSTTATTTGTHTMQRTSPLCHLKRVCELDSNGYKICRSQGAICVPDYTKAAMFDCVCPPSTEKRRYGQESVSEFTCEPKCSSKRSECLRRQAVCKLVDRDEVRCECLPGLMFNQHDQKCYLAKYSYSFNLLVVNRYYEPEAKFHKLKLINNSSDKQPNSDDKIRLFELNGKDRNVVDKTEINEISPHFNNNNNNNNDNDDGVDGDGDQLKGHHQHRASWRSIFITEYNQCNITQVIPKTVIEDPYEHDIESYLGYIDQCNEKIHQNVRTYHLNSRLSEDLRQSLRQHLRDFTVTTNNNSCIEMDPKGMYLNCTVYLQSNEPVQASTVDFVLNTCDSHGQDDRYCWIKPRLLLKKPEPPTKLDQGNSASATNASIKPIGNELQFRQIIPCEIDNFCGQDAFSVRADDKTSLCSCKCPLDIETIDVRDLEPKYENEVDRVSVKEVCAPKNHCGNNSTFCLGKAGSICHYDIRTGSRCNCVYPSYEDSANRCVEITFSTLDSTLIVIIIMLGTGLIVSIGINLAAVAKSKSVFGRSKQYPLNEFPSSRPPNRSTGLPNPVFTND